MAAPATSTTAPWCTIADLPARATDGKFDLDLTAAGEVFTWIQIASDILFDLTGRRWPGATTRTIRPIVADWQGVRSSQMIMSGLGTVVDVRRASTITADGVSEIVLPNPPIVSITEVLIDGDVVAAARYRLDNYARLVYLPTAGVTRSAWPAWQNLDEATTEDGTWSVEYVHGTVPPPGGVKAAATLATELAILDSPQVAGQSRLAQRTTSTSRQGVSASAVDPVSLFQDGQTGIATVDLWIGSANRGVKQRRGRVRRFGHPSHRRPT